MLRWWTVMSFAATRRPQDFFDRLKGRLIVARQPRIGDRVRDRQLEVGDGPRPLEAKSGPGRPAMVPA